MARRLPTWINIKKEFLMANSPCGGCPPCCQSCVFGPKPTKDEVGTEKQIVQTAQQYGCVKGYGDIVIVDGKLGQMRGQNFHPVDFAGAQFLQSSGNDLAQHLGPQQVMSM